MTTTRTAPPPPFFTSGSATGLYCNRLAFLGKVVVPQHDSQKADATNETSVNIGASSGRYKRLESWRPNLFLWRSCYTNCQNRSIPPRAFVGPSVSWRSPRNFKLKVTVSKGLAASCNVNQTRMRVRPGSGPCQSHHAYHDGVFQPSPKQSPVGSSVHGAVQTTTAEEVMRSRKWRLRRKMCNENSSGL
jgi:hypothetical protein